MASENLLALTGEHWRAIEKISDIFADTANLQQAFQIGLECMLSALGKPGAALFVPRCCEHLAQDWTFSSISLEWEHGLNSPGSVLHRHIDQVMESGIAAPGISEVELAGAFPVLSGEKTAGVLLVRGQVIPPAEYGYWQAFLKPFGRAVAMHAKISGNGGGIPNYLDLMRSRNTLRAMFDSLPISIYIIDNAYNLVAVNHSRAERVGDRPNQLVGGKCYEKLYQRSTPCTACRVGETFATGQNTVRLSRNWLDNEHFIEWEVGSFPILDEKDLVIQTIIIEQDVTEKRNLESNLIQSEKLAAVGQLAAGIAHEINNPLTAIIANAQILRREIPTDDDLLDSVKLIEMAGTRAAQVVRNLLGIARKEKYEFEPTDLNETLHNALSLVQHELVGRPIHVDLDLAADMPRVVASQDQLQGVWINLILNAIDAIDKETGSVAVTSRFTGRDFQVTITDNGKGIPAEQLSRVFDPFFTTKSSGRGTGLGLSVCMRVVRHHGGSMQVESQQGKWTRFIVSLPAPR